MGTKYVTVSDRSFELRPMQRDDADAVQAFAASMPAHDLLFLRRDIRNPRVISAWLDQVD